MSMSPDARLAERRRPSNMSDRQAALFGAIAFHSDVAPEEAELTDVIETAVAFLGFLETGESSEVR